MEVFRQICYSSSSTFNPSAYSSLMLDLHHGGSGGAPAPLEREHMFEKVVTPSDVGKLNRLVIPKQHAEKYFPLDPMSGDDKQGIHLCFEDRHGKHWQFRYSYWSSSQSYVMTKGWSRFVKDKQLDSGDTVSFSRAAGAARHGRLFIDWRRHKHSRRRPLPASAGFVVPSHGGSGRRLFSSAAAVPPVYNAADLGLYFYHQLPVPSPAAAALVLESVRVLRGMAGEAGPRRVRLFGVDLECFAMDRREAHDP